VVCLWISTSCVALAASAVRWRIEQAEEFREEVERYSDAERVILADAYQALVLPTVVVGYQVLGVVIVVQAADIIRRP
jgi:hypothetical protein